jgi:hypothetical protein
MQLGVFMEGSCYYRGRKSFPVLNYYICIHNKQFYTRLDLDCYRVRMLPGCFDCTPAYSSTSTVGKFLDRTILQGESIELLRAATKSSQM